MGNRGVVVFFQDILLVRQSLTSSQNVQFHNKIPS
jgi:hypothetical protein